MVYGQHYKTKVYIFTNFEEKKCLIESYYFSYEEGMYNVNLRKQNKYMSPYQYMSSCRKPEIPNELPKITKVKLICLVLIKQWLTVLYFVYFIMF